MTETIPLDIDVEPFPGYRLLGCLGQGGFGSVWEAATPTGRRVALKFLPCSSEMTTAQELRSLQGVRQLRHPHLIRIDQVWCHLGYIVIAMELADGSLHDLYDAGLLDPEKVCQYLSQAAAALDFLNSRQHLIAGRRVAVQHCDVKPSNLLVLGSRVKVADFGISTLTSSQIQTCRHSGTLHFRAPEMLQGRLTDQTDQYSLAVTYCYLRGGRFPFVSAASLSPWSGIGTTPELSMLTALERPIVARALGVVPRQRWSSCGEFMTRLSRVVG